MSVARILFRTAVLAAVGLAFISLCYWGVIGREQGKVRSAAKGVKNHSELVEFFEKYDLGIQDPTIPGSRLYSSLWSRRVLFVHRGLLMTWEFDENDRIVKFTTTEI